MAPEERVLGEDARDQPGDGEGHHNQRVRTLSERQQSEKAEDDGEVADQKGRPYAERGPI